MDRSLKFLSPDEHALIADSFFNYREAIDWVKEQMKSFELEKT